MHKSWLTQMTAAFLGVIATTTAARAVVSINQLQTEIKAGQYAHVITEVNAALPQISPALAPALYMVKGEALAKEKKFAGAALSYLRVPFCYPTASVAPEALLRAAQIEAHQLKDPVAAARILDALVQTYPRTVQAIKARRLMARYSHK